MHQGDPRYADEARRLLPGLVPAVGGPAWNPERPSERAGAGALATPDGEGFADARRHHTVLTSVLGLELRRPPSDSSFCYLFHQVDVAALCTARRDWMIVQIPGGTADLDQLVCDGKTLRGSIVPTAGGSSVFIAQVTL